MESFIVQLGKLRPGEIETGTHCRKETESEQARIGPGFKGYHTGNTIHLLSLRFLICKTGITMPASECGLP